MRSSNGWPASPHPAAINVKSFTIGGVDFPNGVRGGDVETILHYVFEQLHLTVERAHKGWCWGYYFRMNVNNPDAISDHGSATAGDFNAPAHPNGRSGTFSPAQVRRIRMILAVCEGVVKWGGDYHHTKDEMHFGISDTCTFSDVARVAAKLRQKPKPTVKHRLIARLRTPRARQKATDGFVNLLLVQRGKTNHDVLEVQRVLNRWFPAHVEIPEDGHYGVKTAIAMVTARRLLKIKGDITKDRTKRKVLRALGFRTS